MREEDGQKAPSLETLNKHLAEVKKLQPDTGAPAKLPGDAARSAIDFASATAVGIVLGYGVDYWQHTSPWGLLVGLLIGCAAGLKLLFQNEARERANAEKTTKP